jgi:uncharacterized protein involved in outer membrane biogenesis
MGAVVLIFSTIDPNHFRSLISDRIAANSDYNLMINGDLSWQFWPVLTLEAKNVRVEKKIMDASVPLLEVKAVSASTASKEALREDFKKIALKINNGAVKGLDVNGIIVVLKKMAKCLCLVPVPSGGETHFSELTANIVYSENILKNDDLLLKGDEFSVTGSGTIANLNTNLTNYNLFLHFENSNHPLEGRLEFLSDTPIPIHCTGPIKAPVCGPKLDRILDKIVEYEAKTQLNKLKVEIEKNLKTKIDKTLKNGTKDLEGVINESIDTDQILKQILNF